MNWKHKKFHQVCLFLARRLIYKNSAINIFLGLAINLYIYISIGVLKLKKKKKKRKKFCTYESEEEGES